MLDVAEKDPVTPSVPTEKASSLEQKSELQEEERTALPAPNIQEASEPEGAACSEELALMHRRLPTAPPGFTSSWTDKSDPLEDAASLVSIPLGPQLDMSFLGCMQVIVCHNHMTGKVQYQYQSFVISQIVPAAGSS